MIRDVKVQDENGQVLLLKDQRVLSLFNHYVDLDKIKTIENLFNVDFADYYDWRKSLGFNFIDSLNEDGDTKIDLHDFVGEFPKYLIKSEESDKAIAENDWEKIFSLPHMNEDKPNSEEVRLMRNKLFDEFDKLFIAIKDIEELNKLKSQNVLLIDYTREWNRCLFTKSCFVEEDEFYEYIFSDEYYKNFKVIG